MLVASLQDTDSEKAGHIKSHAPDYCQASPDSVSRPRIMLVDDDLTTHTLLKKMLVLHGSEVAVFPGGSIAVLAAKNYRPDLILLSTENSEMDGFMVCEQIKSIDALCNVPVIFLSTSSDVDTKIRAFEAGGADFITKPVHFAELRARIAVHLRIFMLEEKMAQHYQTHKKVREISAAQQATNFALAKLAEYRDEDTGIHLERVMDYCSILAVKLMDASEYASQVNQDFIDCIRHASLLHDIGKVAIPDKILFKPGMLTHEEFEIMKTHTIIGAENMQAIYNQYSNNQLIGMGIEIALYHHERWDGKGYPDGLSGRNIPLSARIMALADYYDALRSDRCYRKGFSHSQVKAMIQEGDGSHFDPVIVKAFMECEEDFKRVMEQSRNQGESVFSTECRIATSKTPVMRLIRTHQ